MFDLSCVYFMIRICVLKLSYFMVFILGRMLWATHGLISFCIYLHKRHQEYIQHPNNYLATSRVAERGPTRAKLLRERAVREAITFASKR
jgi:hypothetical protein